MLAGFTEPQIVRALDSFELEKRIEYTGGKPDPANPLTRGSVFGRGTTPPGANPH